MITKVFCILNICSGTKTLPVASIASPVTFELPITDTPDFNSDDEDGNDSDEELDEEMDPDDIGDPEDLLLDDEDDSDNEELVDKELMDNQRDRVDKENLRDLVDKDEVGHELTGNIGENDNWSINRRSGNNVFESGDNRLCSSNNRNMVDSRNENIDSDNSNTRNGIESGNDRGNINSKNWIGTNRLDSGSNNRIGGSNNNVIDSGIGNNNNQFSNTNNNSGNGISAFIDGRSNSGISARRKPEANSTDQYQLLMYADHFQEFNALIPNTKENRPDPYTTSKHLDPTWLSIEPDKSERTWLSIDPPDNKSDRILRSLDLGNYVSGSDITSSPRLSSPSVGKENQPDPYTTSKHLDTTWLSIDPDESERTWLSIDPDNKSDRILRSLDLGNYVSGPDTTSSPRLSSPSVGKVSLNK
ncbi:putative uncharacterized protein DDB_G0286901 [Diaphorina citri]|uniref:Uncharacterized protein n=1 Tax=Diaphorina citri TaxID=121845 RepID=A0A3Q0IVK7_DIACI|nr:putative uncharacterized protein DDB_G0286901 [Diaphorina citri]